MRLPFDKLWRVTSVKKNRTLLRGLDEVGQLLHEAGHLLYEVGQLLYEVCQQILPDTYLSGGVVGWAQE